MALSCESDQFDSFKADGPPRHPPDASPGDTTSCNFRRAKCAHPLSNQDLPDHQRDFRFLFQENSCRSSSESVPIRHLLVNHICQNCHELCAPSIILAFLASRPSVGQYIRLRQIGVNNNASCSTRISGLELFGSLSFELRCRVLSAPGRLATCPAEHDTYVHKLRAAD
jgi:hypothetical protein